jgi:chloramphenicol 3-O phosphotransferase
MNMPSFLRQNPGKIVVLNGPSSSGKTTLASAVQQTLPGPWVKLSIDAFYSFLPKESGNGWHLFETLTKVMFRTAADFRARGFNVVVDTVFERDDNAEACIRILGSESFYLVGLRCSLPLLEERERVRGNRKPGLARDQATRVHTFCTYDLMLNTEAVSVEECVAEIQKMLDTRSHH